MKTSFDGNLKWFKFAVLKMGSTGFDSGWNSIVSTSSIVFWLVNIKIQTIYTAKITTL